MQTMIHYNSNNPEHMEARKNVKPLSVEEVNEVIETIKYFFRATESFASDEIIEKEKDLIQRLIYHYENLQHFYDVVGGWEAHNQNLANKAATSNYEADSDKVHIVEEVNLNTGESNIYPVTTQDEGWISVNNRLPEAGKETDNKSKVYLNREVKKIGVVGVDSGTLMICDPCYIDGEWIKNGDNVNDYSHRIYECVEDNKLWQFCYGGNPSVKGVNAFPGSYADIITEYGKSPNQLIKEGLFIKRTDIDHRPHIKSGEFSYNGICKATTDDTQDGQLNYRLGHEGVAVAFSSGLGDGTYGVFAEYVDLPDWGRRISKVWVKLIDLSEYMQECKTEK